MKTKTLRRIATEQQSKLISGHFMRNHYYCQLLTPDCIYRDEETGRHLITLIKDVIPTCIVETSHADPSNRGRAVAGRYAMSKRITKRGELSNRKTISKSVLEAAGNPKGDQLGSRIARSYDTNEESAETMPAFCGRDYWDWVRKFGSRVIQWQRPVPERLVGRPVETETTRADERQCVVPKPTLEHQA
ncbi:MAG: hypothetical protein NVSMB58_30510 [Terriglobales bacterium]